MGKVVSRAQFGKSERSVALPGVKPLIVLQTGTEEFSVGAVLN
ncbi:MAG TPA: hypothetical protein VIJ62_08405 [Rhizomicrobium sp.]